MVRNGRANGRRNGEPNGRARNGSSPSPADDRRGEVSPGETRNVLATRIRLLEEAIAEIDAAIAERKRLSGNFRHEVEKELQEVLRHLGYLPPPWSGGYLIDREFFRLSLHKSATSRKKEKRQEELKLWEALVQLMEKRRELVLQLQQLGAVDRRGGSGYSSGK